MENDASLVVLLVTFIVLLVKVSSMKLTSEIILQVYFSCCLGEWVGAKLCSCVQHRWVMCVKGYGNVIKQVIQFMFALLEGGMADTQRHSLS